MQYAESKARFMDMDILVDSRVLIPRPETKLFASVVADQCRKKAWKSPFILEIGTGSGALSFGLVKLIGTCRVIGTDISADALSVAEENLRRFGLEERVTLVRSDMFERFEEGYGNTFDCIVSNPPYVSEKDYEKLDAWVKAEPRIALWAGPEGMDYLNILAERSGKFLRPGGFLALEIGYDQAEKVKDKLRACGFINIDSFKDFNGYERVIVGWKRG
ncbi:MAG: N5-glutamine methyltransferase family protein [Candidatus Omnitrophota bacterium]